MTSVLCALSLLGLGSSLAPEQTGVTAPQEDPQPQEDATTEPDDSSDGEPGEPGDVSDSGPETEEPGAESETPAESAPDQPAATTTDPFQKITIPGFPPEVDIADETTWADLSSAQKDELRAIRARMRAKVAPSEAAAPAVTGESDDERAPLSPRRRSANAAWWNERDENLRTATIAFGVTWGISTVAASIIIGVHVRNAKECSDVTNNAGGIDQGQADRCTDGAEQSLNLAVPGYVLATISGASLIGTVVSGALLGSHRNSRPFIVAGPDFFGLGLTGRLPTF